MHDACPSCGHFVDVSAGQLTSCPGCGHWWIVGGDEAKKAARQAAPTAAPTTEIEDEGDDELDGAPPSRRSAGDGAGRPPGTPPIAGLRTAQMAQPAVEPAGGPFEYEVQYAAGDQWQGPFDRYGLREMLYVGRLTGDEQVRVPGSARHERLGDLAEFEAVLTLLGRTEQTGTHRHSIVGWKKRAGGRKAVTAESSPGSADASAAPAAPTTDAAGAPADVSAPAGPDPRAASSSGPPKALLIGGALFLLAAVAAAVAVAVALS